MKLPRRPTQPAALAEPLQQIDRTFVLERGRRLSYFAGCDYFRLASDPRVLLAARNALDNYGLNVAASRKTTGNHALYEQFEGELAQFFNADNAVLLSSGYITNLAVAQALAGEFTHALIDERAHGSLLDASELLRCPVISFSHRDPSSALKAARKTGRRARLILLTDGLFSHSGEVAPLAGYIQSLPPRTTILLDDTHGAGTLGKTGKGTAEFLDVPTQQLIRTITLSKAFGSYGGAILGSRELRDKIVTRSRIFAGNTPLPLPLAAAAREALSIVRTDLHMRRRLVFNTSHVKAVLREANLPINDGPGPIIPIIPRDPRQVNALKKRLRAAGIHPPYINYLGGPADGYFRIVISSEHTAAQLDALVGALTSMSRLQM